MLKSIRKAQRAAIIVMALLASATSASAINSFGVKYKEGASFIEIRGKTTKPQAQLVESLLDKHKEAIKIVIMSGPGGDFHSGLQIGNAISEANVGVLVQSDDKCISACAFAALAADYLALSGKLMFHAPYLKVVPTTVTVSEIQQATGVAYSDLTVYLATHGYSIHFTKDLLEMTNHCKLLVIGSESDFGRAEDVTKPQQYKREIFDGCNLEKESQ